MELTLHTEGWFDASHHLENYDGKCANSHGHTYLVRVWIRGDSQDIDRKTGILWDFGKLKNILNQFDHKCLNDFYNAEGWGNSTAETQCLYIYNKLKLNNKLKFKVRLYEQINPKRSYCECGDF